MPDKSNFTPDEWGLLLESIMMAGNRRLLWGLLRESLPAATRG
jgi:hypothetical protein